MSKEKTFKVPASLGACTDMILTLREEKARRQREVDVFEVQLTMLEDALIRKLPADDADGVVGKIAKAIIVTKVIPTVEAEAGWEKVYTYLLEGAIETAKHKRLSARALAKHLAQHAAFDLLQKRLNTRAISDRWEAKEAIPGIARFNKKTVSVTKR
jgi:hypothetical protein